MRMQPTSSLPLDLWKQVLAHTSQADRARCSLVSRAFQAAAVAALETVEVSFRDQASVDSLQAWLHNHGQYVKDLQVSSWLEHATLALLACQHLQELDLAQIEVVLPMGPNSPSSHGRDHPWGLTALTNLHLLNCTVAGGLVGLSVLTALKELKVINTVGRSQPCFPGSVFQHYRLLTRLELAAVSFTELHFVSCLVNLQQLIGYTNSIPNITRGLLPGGLPASLRVLELWPIVLDPVVLLGLTNLQELRLVGSSNDFELAGGSAVPLLDAIAAMQRLEELQLSNIRCDWPPPSSAAYSSLTASSNLTRLWLEGCRLPAAASERMFPPAGTLYEFIMFDDDNVSIIVPWQWADVDRLVMHCPALRSVGLGLESSDDLALLTRLSALTRLDARFAGEPIDEGVFVPGAPGDIVIETAAKFTGLRQLQLSVAGPVDMSAVLPLTALQQLTQLEVQAWPSSTVDDTDDWEDFELVSSLRPPEVWLMLLKLCARYPGCHTIIVQELIDQQAQLQQQQVQLAEQVTELQQQEASALSAAIAAQDEVAAARAEAAAARAQASAAEATAHAVRADAAELRADAAELRDQLAALQAAVQHLVHPQATE